MPSFHRLRFSVRAIALLAMVSALLGMPGVAHAYVYWTNGGTIGRANDDGSGVNTSFTTGTGFDVAVNATHVHWGAQAFGVGRADIDGSNPGIFATPAGSAWGVAVDSNYLYFVNQGGPSIERMDLATGANITPLVGTPNPRGVAVDGTYLYWTDVNNRTIGRANLDGTNAIGNFIVSGMTNPTAVAVDSGHIYWATRENGTIGRANLDGSGVNDSFIPGCGFTRGVAVDAGHIYWSTGSNIGRANLDGSGADQAFIVGSGTTGVDVFGVDSIKPVTTDDVPATWQGTAVSVTLTPTDDGGSGLDKTYYTTGTNPADPTTASAVYDPLNKPILNNGEGIKYFSVDKSANAETVKTSTAATVDTVAPVTTDNVPTGGEQATVSVTLSPTDTSGSGVATTYYTTGTNPAAPTTASAVYNPAAKPVLARGEMISYFSVDQIGNAESVRSSAVVGYTNHIVPTVASTLIARTDSATVGCTLRFGNIDRCTVRAYLVYTSATPPLLIGAGSTVASQATGRSTVHVLFNARGRRTLQHHIAGVRVRFAVTAVPVSGPVLWASATALVKPVRFTLAPAFAEFKSNSARLGTGQRAYLNRVVTHVGKAAQLTCTGHVAFDAGTGLAQRLSLARAHAVCYYLNSHGLDASLRLRSAGAGHLRASNATALGRSLNHWVDVAVVR